MKTLKIILNVSLFIACIVHIFSILHNYLNPELPINKEYENNLGDIEFPLIFKLCFHQHNETRILQSLGYERIYMFYMGKSKYNSSLFGWSGHVRNGSTLGSTEGMKGKFYLLMSLILESFRNFNKNFKRITWNSTFFWIVVNKQDLENNWETNSGDFVSHLPIV